MNRELGPLVATYSIVARDSETGDLGVAVQSSYFSVGTEVSWAEPGIGAIATQAIAEVAYGPQGLERLADADGVVCHLLRADVDQRAEKYASESRDECGNSAQPADAFRQGKDPEA